MFCILSLNNEGIVYMFMLIYSTRRKALYKHIFQKVDKDRDNLITFKVCILHIIMCRQLENMC